MNLNCSGSVCSSGVIYGSDVDVCSSASVGCGSHEPICGHLLWKW